MPVEHLALLTAAILIVASLYSSVGHAGASGYIAVMSLFQLTPDQIRPTALVLNIFVACIGTWQFWRAGHFKWRLFWPFALLSVPFAFLGGYIEMPAHAFKVLVGTVLVLSAVRLLVPTPEDVLTTEPRPSIAIPAGAALGLLSGLTGTGGGIFLTPLLLFMRWAKAKQAAAASALFILLNSVAGLLGNLGSTRSVPTFAATLAVAAVVGGTAGSWLGSRWLAHGAIKRLLAVVLLIAGAKLILTTT